MKTSQLLLQDIDLTLKRLASDEGQEGATWILRALNLFMALLPISLFLEHAGKDVPPSSLMTIRSLEEWMLNVESSSSEQTKLLLWDLKQFLRILPGYREELYGKQPDSTEDKYGYNIMIARSLCDAAGASASFATK